MSNADCKLVLKEIQKLRSEIGGKKAKGKTPTRQKGAKRRPSGYNLFMKDCFKQNGRNFKKCAADWKRLPTAKKDGYRARSQACTLNTEDNTWDCTVGSRS